jgi:hypothetical protein
MALINFFAGLAAALEAASAEADTKGMTRH